MKEKIPEHLRKLVEEWKLGEKYDRDGYENLGFDISEGVLRQIRELSDEKDKETVLKTIFPNT